MKQQQSTELLGKPFLPIGILTPRFREEMNKTHI
jgi:hypothetical protein